jgi:amino acid transporter
VTRLPHPPASARKLGLLSLVAATYMMVAGGPFGLEDLVQNTGYSGALVILLVTPLFWSLPTALMVSELSSALPEEGGFYVWVRRGVGPFWGFQEVWLTVIGSVFEMAIYPTLFVEYLDRVAPSLTAGNGALVIGFGLIALCAAWNVLGARAVGDGSIILTLVLLVPFGIMVAYALAQPATARTLAAPDPPLDLMGGILIAMWNYMGWDNVSTVAGEVDRPQRNYPRAMVIAVSLVVLTYLLPVAAVMRTDVDRALWDTGGWVDIARTLGGPTLALAIAAAGAFGALGTFNALMLSFSRLPTAMSRDGFLPPIFAQRHPRTDAPWVSVAALALCWGAGLQLGFERLIMLNVLLTGLSILLEFWALVGLRIREPGLPRPYRIPGGLWVAVAIGLPPLGLILMSIVRTYQEEAGPIGALTLALVLIAAGPLLYLLRDRRLREVRRDPRD